MVSCSKIGVSRIAIIIVMHSQTCTTTHMIEGKQNGKCKLVHQTVN